MKNRLKMKILIENITNNILEYILLYQNFNSQYLK